MLMRPAFGSDVDEIKAAKSKLETSAQKVFSAMYENMQQAGRDAGCRTCSGYGAIWAAELTAAHLLMMRVRMW